MERLKKKRGHLRSAFTKAADDLELKLQVTDRSELIMQNIKVAFGQVSDKFERLAEVQEEIESLLLDDDAVTEEVYANDADVAETYRDRYNSLKISVDEMLLYQIKNQSPVRSLSSDNKSNLKTPHKCSHYFSQSIRFSGSIKEWIPWWGQFKKIHNAEDLTTEDKFQLLLKGMVPGSKAYNLVNSFPPSAGNYPKAIEQLEQRYGRKDLQVQFYIRELLGMVMKNAVQGKVCDDLTTLYDTLEGHLRALEDLDKPKNLFSDFLAPLVESCLPVDLLRAWERNRTVNIEQNPETTSIDVLMQFIRKEVEGDQFVYLARENFGFKVSSKVRNAQISKSVINTNESEPTVAALVATEYPSGTNSQFCLFCGQAHNSTSCVKAEKLSLDERRKIVVKKKACFVCLRIGHNSSSCRSKYRCSICKRRHAFILCSDLTEAESNQKKDMSASINVDSQVPNLNTLCNMQENVRVYLCTMVVNLYFEGKSWLTRCLIDIGSEKSYITEYAINKLKMKPIGSETMGHVLFGGLETEPQHHEIHEICLGNLNNTYKCTFKVRSQKSICGSVVIMPMEEQVRVMNEYGLKLAELPQGPTDVNILIGADVAGKLLNGQIISVDRGLTAIGTHLGWTVMGQSVSNMQPLKKDVTITALSLFVGDASISDLWKLDILGILDTAEIKPKEVHLKTLQKELQETIAINNEGRYIVGLPWKQDHPPLSNNKKLAFSRTINTCKKLKEGNLLEGYKAVFDTWLQNGMIEKVKPDYHDIQGCYYLPHRPIIKLGSTTPIRPVFDASSHIKSAPSLNDCLEKGPNLIEEIPNVLERFRCGRIGIISDVEKAFLQMEVSEGDRDYLRFFGTDGFTIYRHCRVVFGVNSSPFLLAVVFKFHFDKMRNIYVNTVQKLEESFYVDNSVTSVQTKEELEIFITEAKHVMSMGCFNLRGWESNCVSSFTAEVENREVPVLGMIWKLKEDTLKINTPCINEESEVVTKRSILSHAQKVFDPIGYTCPVMLIPKLLLQDLWATKLSWDQPVPRDVCVQFKKWLDQVPLLGKIEIPRFSGMNSDSELHVFCDASKKAYATCIFIRTITSEDISIRLLRAKTRVAPLDKLTIPRLELLACLIGTRLANSLKGALGNIDLKTTYWTDAVDALCWIHNEGTWSTFVQNRVKEIHRLSNPECWRYVPGEKNPADLPSRGCSGVNLLSQKWWEGPQWLKRPEKEWPSQAFVTLKLKDNNEKKEMVVSNLNIVEAPGIHIQRLWTFSNYPKILKVFSWMLRFMFNCQKPIAIRKKEKVLAAHELVNAEKILFRLVQQANITGHRKKSLAKISQDENGLLRMDTRITERDDSEDFIHPIILPGDHLLVKRLIEHQHKQSCHAGPQILFGVLREKYWIIGARKAIRQVVLNCLRCRRYLVKSFSADPVTLPKDRVENAPIFGTTGVDLAGPLYLKGNAKVWIVIFTCAVYRAVHLELVSSLSTESFLQCLRRFISRRGKPLIVYSDRGTNFMGTVGELQKIDWSKIQEEKADIKWKLNPPAAPWWGGWYERLVRIIKDLLKKTLNRTSLSYEELLTVLCDCEMVINARPLTYSTGETDELVPLTPNLFLRDIPRECVLDLDIIDASYLRRRIKYRLELMSRLRQRFRNEYLGKLVFPADHSCHSRPVELGEVVLVGDSNKKRVTWPLGVIVKVYPGKDGKVRCVKVKTSTGILDRPIQRIYPLELRSNLLPDFDRLVVSKAEDSKSIEGSSKDQLLQSPEKTRSGRLIKIPNRYDL